MHRTKGIDWITIILWIIILAFGIMNIYSVDPDKGIKQLIFSGLGLIMLFVMIGAYSFDKSFYETYSPFLYIFALILLAGVLVLGKEIKGARAWYTFGSFSYQPAEFAKFATALFIGKIISQSDSDLKSVKTICYALAALAVPIGLIMLQPDLGSVLVFSAIIIALYREGLSPLFIIIPVIALIIFLISIVVTPFYVLIAFAYITMIIALIALAFTYNRDTIRAIHGIFISMIVFFFILIAAVYYVPTMSSDTIETFSTVYPSMAFSFYDPLKSLVLIFSVIGIVISIIPLIVGLFDVEKMSSNSPFKYKSGIKSNLVITSSIFSVIILVIIMSISTLSPILFEGLPKHQKERVMVLYEGERKYRDTSGYNLLYSKTAIGSGDLLGKGYNQGTVKQGKFVPEQWTDYIFCTVGEEWGFVGSVALILVYALFIARIYFVAETLKSRFSRFFGYCVATFLLIHFFINIAMVLGLFPTVGIPLPLFSYGGSSLWGFIMLLGTFLILVYREKQNLI